MDIGKIENFCYKMISFSLRELKFIGNMHFSYTERLAWAKAEKILSLCKSNIIFCCAGPTNPNFWGNQHNNNTDFRDKHFFFFTIYVSSNMIFFF